MQLFFCESALCTLLADLGGFWLIFDWVVRIDFCRKEKIIIFEKNMN